MPVNKRESMVFTVLMCAFMVFVMSVYNVIRIHGFNSEVMKTAWLGFPLAYIIALASDWFIVGPIAKKVAFKFIGLNTPVWKKVIIISTCMVTGMVLIMSLFGSIAGAGLSSKTLIIWLYNIPFNFIVALPLQMVIAGPVIRIIFRKAFPEGSIAY